MNVFVGFEFTATVRDAFIRAGHDAVSCDLRPSESDLGPHHQGDIIEFLEMCDRFDIGIVHPDCTHMAVCGNGTWAGTQEREQSIQWTLALWEKMKRKCDRVCLEQPVSALAMRMPIPAVYVQPFNFGHPETKRTALWLHNLPKLRPTCSTYDEMMTLPASQRHRIHYMTPSEDRGKERSRFYPGIAQAMAEQWGSLPLIVQRQRTSA